MNSSDKNNTDKLIELVAERDRIGEFERQFRNSEGGNVLKEGVTLETIFEKAGYKPMKWRNLSPMMPLYVVDAKDKGAYGISANPGDAESGQLIFGNSDEGVYYFVLKSGNGFSWSRMWTENGIQKISDLNNNSTLSNMIGLVAYHKFGEEKVHEVKEVEMVTGIRKTVKTKLHPPKKTLKVDANGPATSA